MFDKIMNMVKDQVTSSIGSIPGIPADKKSQVVETTTTSLMDGLKQHAAGGGLGSLLGIGGGSASSGLESGVISALTQKAGLSPAIAQSVVAAAIPAVMSLLKKHAGDPSSGLNLQSMVSGLTGGKGGGIMGALGGIFGKKG